MRSICFIRCCIRLITATCLFSCFTVRTYACPACNIHNDLADSVYLSKNIIVGKVVKPTFSVTVIRVLRGTNAIGSVVSVAEQFNPQDIGKEFILSDGYPNCESPTYYMLPSEYEWEIRFLLRNTTFNPNAPIAYSRHQPPEAWHAVDAVRCVESMSYMTTGQGLNYVKSHPRDCAGLIRKELDKILSTTEPAENPHNTAFSLNELLSAYWLSDKESAVRFSRDHLQDFLRQKGRLIKVDSNQSDAGVEAEFLVSVFQQSTNSPSLRAELKTSILNTLPHLESTSLVPVIYALERSKLEDGKHLQSAIANLLISDNGKRDSAALAYYQLGWFYGRWWKFEDAMVNFRAAEKLCDNAGLLDGIHERIGVLEARNKPSR